MRWCWVNFQYRGVLLVWIIVEQGPTGLTVGAGGGCLDIFSRVYHFSPLSHSLSGRRPDIDRNTISKGRLTRKQPTKQINILKQDKKHSGLVLYILVWFYH